MRKKRLNEIAGIALLEKDFEAKWNNQKIGNGGNDEQKKGIFYSLRKKSLIRKGTGSFIKTKNKHCRSFLGLN